MRSKFVLVLSDMHVFHALALAPRDFTASTGVTLRLNKIQEYITDCYYDMIDRLPDVVDMLVINGEPTEGQNIAEQARELSEVDPLFQLRGAIKLIEPIRARIPEDGKVIITSGSRYHSGSGSWIEESLGEKLGSVKNDLGHHVWAKFDGEVFGVWWDIAHHQSYVTVNQNMPITREVRHFLESRARKRLDVPDTVVIVRSHTHCGLRAIEEDGIVAVSTPSWKAQDRFARSGRMPNKQPISIGAVGFRIYDKPVDGSIVHLVRYLFPSPEVRI